jgi:hypothetical protein
VVFKLQRQVHFKFQKSDSLEFELKGKIGNDKFFFNVNRKVTSRENQNDQSSPT